jgi:anti-sigma B factor antagonist
VRGRVVTRTAVNGLTLVALAGELDLSVAPALRAALCPAPDATLPDVAADLVLVDFMDCAVVGAFTSAARSVRAGGGCLRVSGLAPGPTRLARLCHLDDVVCVHDTLAAASAPVCSRHGARSTAGTPMMPLLPSS